jgi:hypothetical protein
MSADSAAWRRGGSGEYEFTPLSCCTHATVVDLTNWKAREAWRRGRRAAQ